MTVERWLSALLTYLVPYTVNIHGQWIAQLRSLSPTTSKVIRDLVEQQNSLTLVGADR